MKIDKLHTLYRRLSRKPRGDKRSGIALARRPGVILVGVVVGILFLAMLAMVLIPIFSSSVATAPPANDSTKAFYLAESGWRYAGSLFLHSGIGIVKDLALNTVHGKTYNFTNEGSFEIRIESFFYNFRVLQGSTLMADAFGLIPSVLAPNGTGVTGKIAVQSLSRSFTYFDFNGYTIPQVDGVNGTEIHFNNVTATSGARVFPAVELTAPATLTQNGTLTLPTTGAGGTVLFPEQYGYLVFLTSAGIPKSDDTFRYQAKSTGTPVQLSNIVISDNPTGTFSLSLEAGDYVVLQRTMAFTSIGRFGMAERKLMYMTGAKADLSGGTSSKKEYTPDFSEMVGGHTSLGEWGIENLGGNEALTPVATTSGRRVEAYVGIPSIEPNPFLQAWNNTGGFLSYDVQVKIGTGEWDPLTNTFINKPDQYCGGLTVRVESPIIPGLYHSYGLSYIKTNDLISPADGISDALVPNAAMSDVPMVLLWSREDRSVSGDVWLAYMSLTNAGVPVDQVVDSSGHLKDWSTVLVRVLEAAAVRHDGGTSMIEPGDYILGETTGATAIVIRKIATASGEWLLLNNVVGAFSSGETIGGTALTIQEYRSRDNYIEAYIGDTGPSSSGDSNPFNTARKGIARNPDGSSVYYWPVNTLSDWAEDNDYFRLIQWTGTNASVDPTATLLANDTVVRTNRWTSAGLDTVNLPPFIGIHALGDSAVNVYFDDLAINLVTGEGGTGQGFEPPILQQ